jgi:hypothetical protein
MVLVRAVKQPPTIVEAIDRELTVLYHRASGTEPTSVEDLLSRELAKTLLRARELGETLQGILTDH